MQPYVFLANKRALFYNKGKCIDRITMPLLSTLKARSTFLSPLLPINTKIVLSLCQCDLMFTQNPRTQARPLLCQTPNLTTSAEIDLSFHHGWIFINCLSWSYFWY